MNENARLSVALGVDMKIISSSCDTTADIFAVVLEVDSKNAFTSTAFALVTDSTVNIFSLLR